MALVQTLLAMTQDILSAINAEEVNSIEDTVEASQVAQIIIDTYYELATLRAHPEHKELAQLTALSDSTRPNFLKLPDGVFRMYYDHFWYNKADAGENTSFARVYWVEPDVFIERSHNISSDAATTVEVIDITGPTTFYISDDQHPSYFTSFDDEHIVCNSYDSAVDTTLQATKTKAYVIKPPSLTKSDASIPDLDPNFFPYLKAESRARAFAWQDKQPDQKAEQSARRVKVDLQNELMRVGTIDGKRKYGR